MSKYLFPKKIGKQWIAALKSSTYNQGRITMCGKNVKDEQHYCVLGVLGNLLGIEDSELKKATYLTDIKDERIEEIFPYLTAPAGKNNYDQPITLEILLGKMNDSYTDQKTFKDLAKWLKENLELI